MTKPESNPETDQSPEQTPTEARIVKAPPSRQASVYIPAAVLGLADAAILLRSGRSLLVALLFGTILGLFIGYFLSRTHHRLTARYLRESGLSDSARNSPAPLGGWANPTTGQRFVKRAQAALSITKKRPR
jgi:hypothetical protein